jgi:HD-like signal output (HDOD) protein
MTNPLEAKHKLQELILSQPIDIPVFHGVALRLQQMMNDRSYRIEEAIKLVHEDTALASEMLRHANTTYNAGMEPITTIKNAIVRLGSQQVVNLAFTASMASCKSDHNFINARLEALWRHCHSVAVTSAWLAIQTKHEMKIPEINADEVYLAGLFHDIGKLYLLKAMDRLTDREILLFDPNALDETLERLNVQQGIRVMQHWSIPEIYTDAVGRHTRDDWQSGTNAYLVAAVRLSCKIHQFIEQGVELSQTSETFRQVSDELSVLGVEDVAYVSDLVRAITD